MVDDPTKDAENLIGLPCGPDMQDNKKLFKGLSIKRCMVVILNAQHPRYDEVAHSQLSSHMESNTFSRPHRHTKLFPKRH